MAIFNSYVRLPEGKRPVKPLFWDPKPRPHLEGTAGAPDRQAPPRTRSGPRNNLQPRIGKQPPFFLKWGPWFFGKMAMEKWREMSHEYIFFEDEYDDLPIKLLWCSIATLNNQRVNDAITLCQMLGISLRIWFCVRILINLACGKNAEIILELDSKTYQRFTGTIK